MGDNLYSKKEGGTIYGWFFDPRLGKARYICLRTKDKRVARIRLRDAERAAYDSRDPTAHGPPYALSQALEDFLTAAASHLSLIHI